jgi:hypothetical protein
MRTIIDLPEEQIKALHSYWKIGLLQAFESE